MNFLLHRHFAELELGSPAAGIGAMLPDLWRMADRRVRPRERPPAPADDATLEDVLAGIEHHVAIDRWFHATPELMAGEQLCAGLLRSAAPASLRAGLFAHVTWEMALDGALVAKVGAAHLRRTLEDSFAATELARGQAAEVHYFSRIERQIDDRATFDLRMKRLTSELGRGGAGGFGAGGWIESYRTGAGLVACLSGIRSRLGLPAIGAEDHGRIAAALDQVVIEASLALGSLFARRDQDLKGHDEAELASGARAP